MMAVMIVPLVVELLIVCCVDVSYIIHHILSGSILHQGHVKNCHVLGSSQVYSYTQVYFKYKIVVEPEKNY